MLQVTPIPIFNDNYVWVLHGRASEKAIVVDPGDGPAVLQFLEQRSLSLEGILVTHSHYDHIGGINDLLQCRQVDVFGPECPAIPQVTRHLREGDQFDLWGAAVTVMEVPGHLPEHLCYIIEHEGTTQLFSGDLLFSSGCGRIFNGTHQQLKRSLDRVKQLPENTHVYAAHEYTIANLSFARTVEPENAALLKRLQQVIALREKQQPSLPTNIGLERSVNPFLRCDQQSVIASASTQLPHPPNGELEVFTALREWKDRF